MAGSVLASTNKAISKYQARAQRDLNQFEPKHLEFLVLHEIN